LFTSMYLTILFFQLHKKSKVFALCYSDPSIWSTFLQAPVPPKNIKVFDAVIPRLYLSDLVHPTYYTTDVRFRTRRRKEDLETGGFSSHGTKDLKPFVPPFSQVSDDNHCRIWRFFLGPPAPRRSFLASQDDWMTLAFVYLVRSFQPRKVPSVPFPSEDPFHFSGFIHSPTPPHPPFPGPLPKA